MKKYLFFLCAVVVALAGCGGAGGGKSGGGGNPSDIETVPTIAPSTMSPITGATKTPASLADTVALLSSLASDPVISDLQSGFDVSSSSKSMEVLSKAIGTVVAFKGMGGPSSGFTTQLQKVVADIQDFPMKRSISESINLSGEFLSTYLILTTGEAAFSASAATTDNGPLDIVSMSNFKSGSGQATMKIAIDSPGLPAASAIKYLKVNLNAGGTFSIGSKNSGGIVKPANLSFDYAESSAVALSVVSSTSDPDGKFPGCKIVLKVDVKGAATIADPTAAGASGYASFVPSAIISLKVFDDSDTATVDKTWNDMDSFIADMAGLGG
jgi:hypothetical protein